MSPESKEGEIYIEKIELVGWEKGRTIYQHIYTYYTNIYSIYRQTKQIQTQTYTIRLDKVGGQ